MYVHSEKQFDFGPLLIGKDPAKKDDENIKGMNSSTFRITNNGKFETTINFYFASETITEDDPESSEFQSGVFLLDPPEMTLGID